MFIQGDKKASGRALALGALALKFALLTNMVFAEEKVGFPWII
jgi:hypothetical protein